MTRGTEYSTVDSNGYSMSEFIAVTLLLFWTLQNAVQLLNEALVELNGTHDSVKVRVGLIAERRTQLNVLGTVEAAFIELAEARTLGTLTLVSHLGNRVHVAWC